MSDWMDLVPCGTCGASLAHCFCLPGAYQCAVCGAWFELANLPGASYGQRGLPLPECCGPLVWVSSRARTELVRTPNEEG